MKKLLSFTESGKRKIPHAGGMGMESKQEAGMELGRLTAVEPSTGVPMETERLVFETTEVEGGRGEGGEGGGGVEDVAMLELVDQMEIEISDHEGEGEERQAQGREEDLVEKPSKKVVTMSE